MRITPLGRTIGTRSGRASSLCWDRKKKTAGNPSAKPTYPRTGAYPLRLRLPGGWGSLSQYLALKVVLCFAHGQEGVL
ncbi:hypothetical protein [Candidatus Methylacidithermus pantelleriae]|uniref:Uncharacterized protein n=1 Tax=Candidatus Methylacidithermus pantelleriae TaxID=2744239 RepID=A0A8J2FPU2_9BACT|nr:hypothetical protein [Candidatus Methylacidithermus pantelleriae]CAF0705050.1 hypothetical protein MPNT_80085 [Candidatus Methylacidithermus pantelleriae]